MLAGIDCSYDTLTEQEADDLWNAGIRVFQQCLWTGAEQPPPRVINLRVAQQRGFTLLGYSSITPSHPGSWHMQMGRSGVPDDLWEQMVKIPVDVELPGLTIDMVKDALAQQEIMGKPRDIYTSYNVWVNMMGNPAHPEGTGLQDANWNGQADLVMQRPYGGWTSIWGHQYRGGSYINGQYADSNVFDLEPVQPVPQPVQPGKETLRFLLNAALAEVEKLP